MSELVHGTDDPAEDVLGEDGEGEGEVVVQWAELVLQAIPAGVPAIVPVAEVPASFDPEAFSQWTVWDALTLEDRRAVLQLPWGVTAEVPLPAPGLTLTAPWSE